MTVSRLAAFLAIVWGVAASFVVFDVLFVFGAGRLIRSGGPFEALAPSALRNSDVCLGRDGPDDGSRASSSEVRAPAWTLGVQFGLHARAAAILAEYSEGPAKEKARAFVAGRRQIVDAVAASLNVPSPPSFTPANPATTNVEFVPFVEDRGNQTARALAAAYGSGVCELYKMGAYWGFAVPVRTTLPGEPNIMAVEITYYARRLHLPESLWQPMVEPTPADASRDALAAEADAATDRFTLYLQDPASADAPRR